jgi:hypothetical protein
MCQNIKCPGRGSRHGGGEHVRASSEAETRSRGCLALERGGTLSEGAASPRARRNLVRRGVQPSSEAGVLLVRAKRSFARGWLGLTVLVGRWGRQDRGPLLLIRDCFRRVLRLCVRLCFVICGRKWVFPGYLGDPYGCPRHLGPHRPGSWPSPTSGYDLPEDPLT